MRLTRRALVSAAAAALILGTGTLARSQPRVIKVKVRRFAFTPNHIELRKAEPVTIELTTEDIVMGMSIPDFKVRADIVPGQTSRLDFTPDRAGTFAFLCDIFCGDGHEGMSGTLVVT